ncbi:MAG: elongation factor P maturation arginine rhamnosyltransferase EarP, partial [Pseudohongiella sp.]
NLLAQHQRWQTDQRQTRAELLQALGINAQDLAEGWHSANLLVSLFAYTRPAGSRALSSWFAAMAEGGEPALCLVPAGDLLADVAGALGRTLIPSVGDVMTMGSLSVVVIPFLPMDDYDRLLSVCDLNLVRGEDSFVRAQWAAKPLVWHIYPQQDDAHRVKLDAFLARYGDTNGGADSREVLLEFNRFWNLDADCGKLWHDLRPQLPDLIHGARNWQQKLAELPDLASSLMQFYRNRP